MTVGRNTSISLLEKLLQKIASSIKGNFTPLTLGLAFLLIACNNKSVEDETPPPCYQEISTISYAENYTVHTAVKGSAIAGFIEGRMYDSLWQASIFEPYFRNADIVTLNIETYDKDGFLSGDQPFVNRLVELLSLGFPVREGCYKFLDNGDNIELAEIKYSHTDYDIIEHNYNIINHPDPHMNTLEITQITTDSIFGHFSAYFERMEKTKDLALHPDYLAIYNCEFSVGLE